MLFFVFFFMGYLCLLVVLRRMLFSTGFLLALCVSCLDAASMRDKSVARTDLASEKSRDLEQLEVKCLR
jgi:hypothetical protein